MPTSRRRPPMTWTVTLTYVDPKEAQTLRGVPAFTKQDACAVALRRAAVAQSNRLSVAAVRDGR